MSLRAAFPVGRRPESGDYRRLSTKRKRLLLEPLEERRLLALVGVLSDFEFPNVAYDNSGTVSYTASTDRFQLRATPLTFDDGSTLGFFLGADDTLSIDIQVDDQGNLVGGVAGDDLVLSGDLDTNGDFVPDLSGVLLTGEVTAFGFRDAGSTDEFDFRFTPTSGPLASSFFGGKDIGVFTASEQSTFTGFTTDFGGGAKGNLAPIPPGAPDIDLVKEVLDPNTGLFTQETVTFPVGDPVTFRYTVTNPGGLPLDEVTVVDDRATPGDPSDDVTLTIDSPAFVGGDDGNGLLDPGESWQFELTIPAEFIGDGALGPISEMNKYLLIGTTSNEIAKGVNVQNGDLGADVVVLSTEIDDNVDFDNDDVFLNNAGSQWVDVDNQPNTDPDFLPGAAQVGEGVTWTGDVALTSPDAAFDLSNVELFGQVGVVADSSNPVSSVSNSLFFPDGVGDGVDPAGGLALPPNGVTADANAEMAALRAELDGFEQFVTDLAPEATLGGNNGFPDFEGIEDEEIFELNVDPFDTNGDGIAVIDILIDGGNSDFKITNSNWIIESEQDTFAIFRILGDSNLVLNQSTIVLGDGILRNGGDPSAGPGDPGTDLGAIFIKANDYSDGASGRNGGEALDSGDTVFSFNDTVLNGVGFYDLIAFDEENSDPFFDNGTTELKINNGQGCAHFISPKINFNNVRFDRCSLPELGEQEQTNTAEATGTASGIDATDADEQTIVVSSSGTTSQSANSAPIASNDAFSTRQGEVLVANGVLDNDTDPDGDTLSAALVANPLNGTLDLKDDGTFVYTPYAGYSGTDSFTYVASDGAATSKIATVTIEVASNAPPAKRFYVVDTSADASFIYNAEGTSITSFGFSGDNSAPRGAAANVAGDVLWVVDADDRVYVYDGEEGSLQRSWKADGLKRPEGIATDEVDIWIVDRRLNEVFYYANGATATSDQNPTNSFDLAPGNSRARGITTDGSYLWVVNDTWNTDEVFKYTIAGDFLGSWQIDSRNSSPRGVTIDPSNPDHIWIVDGGTDQFFKYSGAVARTTGSQAADGIFDLLPGNSNPQGIADPPTGKQTQLPTEDFFAQLAPSRGFDRVADGRVAVRPMVSVHEPSSAGAFPWESRAAATLRQRLLEDGFDFPLPRSAYELDRADSSEDLGADAFFRQLGAREDPGAGGFWVLLR